LAFTLAEVLITLAIIGIIAAITIPSIVANHKKTALETQFAKAYRTLSQAVNLAVAEHGEMETWAWQEAYTQEEQDNFVKTYLLPYFNVQKFCSATNPNTGCFPDVMYKYLNGADWTPFATNAASKVLLADGMAIQFSFVSSCYANKRRCLGFNVDINGYVPPNVHGIDVHTFDIYPQTGEFLPYGINLERSYNEATGSYTKLTEEQTNSKCGKGTSGDFCAAKIISEGFKMNYDW